MVTNLLNEFDWDEVREEADRQHRRYVNSVHGQMVTPSDGAEYHVYWATQDALLAKLKQQPADAWRYTDASGTHFTDDFNDIQDTPGIEEWTPLLDITRFVE